MMKPEKQFANFGVALLKDAVVEFVRNNPGLSTTEIDKGLQLDKIMGTSKKLVAHGLLKLLEKNESRLRSDKKGKERLWWVA